MSAWFLLAVVGWLVGMSGLWLKSRRLNQARRGRLPAEPQGWCIARGAITAVPPGLAARDGHTSHALFRVAGPNRVWFVRQQVGGGARVFGPMPGVLQWLGDTAQYELRVGLGDVAWVVGVAVFLLSAIVLATGGAVWLFAGSGVVLGAVGLQVRSERRKAPMVAAEILRALQAAV